MAGLLIVIFSASLFAATYESRSDKYALSINVEPVGGKLQYDVRVTDLATKRVYVFPPVIAGPDDYPEALFEESGVKMRVRLGTAQQSFSADLTVMPGGTLYTVWNTTPPMVRLTVADATRVGGDVKAPVVLSRVEPYYPESARADRISGIVILEVVVDHSGIVKEAVILKDLPHGLGLAALDAVRQWRFSPATRNGEPVDVIFNLTVNFRLR